MDLVSWTERLGEGPVAALFGLLTGLVFGIAAQRSAFCLRAAAVEFARGKLGSRMAIWLLTFSTAMVWVQLAQMAGLFRSDDARMMAVAGSFSGAIIGGLMFGFGMVMSRGCPGRLLVLASTGNLRSVMSGLLFAVVAQMSLHGLLSPSRDWLARLWMTPDGTNIDMLRWAGLPRETGLVIGVGFAIAALVLARRAQLTPRVLIFASGVGFSVALGWVLTWNLAQVAFDPVSVSSVTFSGPSANTLMFFLEWGQKLGFDVGLVPGVVIGAFLAAFVGRELAFQGFDSMQSMRRSMIGAALMGFGAMLAGGCSIGAGVTGGSIFVITAWVALVCFFLGAIVADIVLDQRGAREGAH